MLEAFLLLNRNDYLYEVFDKTWEIIMNTPSHFFESFLRTMKGAV